MLLSHLQIQDNTTFSSDRFSVFEHVGKLNSPTSSLSVVPGHFDVHHDMALVWNCPNAAMCTQLDDRVLGVQVGNGSTGLSAFRVQDPMHMCFTLSDTAVHVSRWRLALVLTCCMEINSNSPCLIHDLHQEGGKITVMYTMPN